jgi:hypothetical protein
LIGRREPLNENTYVPSVTASKLNSIAQILVVVLIATYATVARCAEGERYVGVEWVWFTDYVYFSSEWTLDSEPGCRLEVGLGVKVRDSPLGGKMSFAAHLAFTTYGFGAIHVRAVSGDAPCLVKLRQGLASAVGVYGDPSVTKGVIRDGKIVYRNTKEVVGNTVDEVTK